jgi:hypothetical protein
VAALRQEVPCEIAAAMQADLQLLRPSAAMAAVQQAVEACSPAPSGRAQGQGQAAGAACAAGAAAQGLGRGGDGGGTPQGRAGASTPGGGALASARPAGEAEALGATMSDAMHKIPQLKWVQLHWGPGVKGGGLHPPFKPLTHVRPAGPVPLPPARPPPHPPNPYPPRPPHAHACAGPGWTRPCSACRV